MTVTDPPLSADRWSMPAIVLAGLFFLSLRPTPAAAAEPDWEKIKEVVERHLRSNVQYRPGDLISRADVEPIFNELLELGLKAPGNVEEMYDSFLPPHDYLVNTFHSTYGRKFMRRVAGLSGAYDRLERMSWTTKGREWLNELIVHPQGPEVFKDMISPAGAKKMEQELAGDPRGKNFLLPTGHVHTAEDLLNHLQRKMSSPGGK
jgi:hypothetical protein